VQDPVELEKWLLVKCDQVQISNTDAALAQAISGRLGWKSGVMFFARKPLLLGRRHNLAVPDQAGGAIVVKGREAQDVRRAHSTR